MKNFSLRMKLFLLSGFLILVSVAIGTISYTYSAKSQRAYDQVVEEDVKALREMNRMLLAFRMARIELLHLAHPSSTEDMQADSIKAIKEQWGHFNDEDKSYSSHDFNAEEEKLYKEFKEAMAVVKKDFDRALELHKAAGGVVDSPEHKAMQRVVVHDIAQHGIAVRDTTKKLIEFQAKQIQADTAEAIDATHTGNKASLLALILGMLVGCLATYFYTTNLVNNLERTMQNIASASNQVSSASTQIAAASDELSQASTQQAASLQQTTASVEEISAMINKNADNAKQSNQISEASRTSMTEGEAAVNHMIQAIQDIDASNNEITRQIEHSNREIGEIVKVIAEIGNKTKVINDIVFQTKLLSFNASVEAARAGEHGKGFAVVAEEVGNLAAMSGNAAKEITSMLEGSIHKVEGIVSATRSKIEGLVSVGKEKVETGSQVARRCGEVFGQIAKNIESVGARVSEISVASQEQAQGVQEINKAMVQLDQVTQQNSSVSQQSASSAHALSDQAVVLSEAIHELVVTVHGVKKAAARCETVVVAKTTPGSHAKASGAKVLALKPIRRRNESVMKKAVGSDMVPSSDDSRFEDV